MHQIVVGLGFGDEGKGGIVDFLCRRDSAHTVVRFNGGAQAGHNVVLPDGKHHTFAQFGSGTFAGAKTHLSSYMLVNPLFLEPERKHLEELGIDTDGLLTIEGSALVTTPFHVAANRLMELQRSKRNGSCGMGIGETVSDFLECPERSIYVKDFYTIDILVEKLQELQERRAAVFQALIPDPDEASARELAILQDPGMIEYCVECFYHPFHKKYEVVDERYLKSLFQETLIFEGAQGCLLDENFGFNPYTTWSTTTSRNALKLLDGQPSNTIGVTRAYHTRHGAGPFPTEDVRLLYPDHNCKGPWQGDFRFGSLDLVLLRYARFLTRCSGIAVTCLDHLPEEADADVRLRVCTNYAKNIGVPWEQYLYANRGRPEEDQLACLVEECRPVWEFVHNREGILDKIREATRLPVTITSEGPTYKDKQCL